MLTSERLPFALPFPRISPDGRYLAGGQRTCRVYRVGQWDKPIYEDKDGALPGWYYQSTVAYVRGRNVMACHVNERVPFQIATDLPGTNYFTVAPGAWAVHNKKQIIVNGVVRAENALPHFAVYGDWLAYQDAALVVHVLRGTAEVGRYANLGGECRGMTIDADGVVMVRVKGKTWELSAGIASNWTPAVAESCPIVLPNAKLASVTPDGRLLLRRFLPDRAVIVAPAGDQSFDAVLLPDNSIATVSQHPDVGVRWCVVPPDAAEEPIVPPAPSPDVQPFAHHFWMAAYKDAGNDAPRNVALCVDGTNPIPATGPIIIDHGHLLSIEPEEEARVVGLYVESVGADGNLAEVERLAGIIRESWAIGDSRPCPPVIAYVGAAVPDKPIPGVDVVLLEGRCTDKTPDPVQSLADKSILAHKRGILFGYVLDATDGVLNGAPMGGATDAQIAWWWDQFDEGIREYQPPFVFVWAWSREHKGVEHGLKAHPHTQAWVRAIVAAIPPQEAPMIWTDAMRDLLLRFAAKVGGWNGTTWTDPANAPIHGDDSARAWTKKCAEQFAHSRNNGWGCKAQTPSHPQSTDGLAYIDDRLWVFDVLANSGAANCTLNDRPTAVDATGQEFIAVEAHDWISETPEPPPPPDIEARLVALERQVAKLTAKAKQVWPNQF